MNPIYTSVTQGNRFFWLRKEMALSTRASGRLIRTDKIHTTASSNKINNFFFPRVENGFTIAEKEQVF